MSRLTKADVQAAYARGRADGYGEGFVIGKREGLNSVAVRDAQVKLINAVGQTLQTQASLMNGLAQALDCGPRS